MWPFANAALPTAPAPFQSLKGFQRFCGASLKSRQSLPILFQSLKGFQRFCGLKELSIGIILQKVSIPKRVSEVLWLNSLSSAPTIDPSSVSIPKRVSEVLWLLALPLLLQRQTVSIPKRVSEVLWPHQDTILQIPHQSFNP